MLETKTKSLPYSENWKFIEDHRDELMEKYPEHWIAVVEKEVVAADPDPWRFMDKLREIGPPPKGEPDYMEIELLTSEEIDWIHPW